jgi:GTP-binding protein EngB required for normal cell division
VGVTPVTAVPTRLEHGEKAHAVVSFSETNPRRIAIGTLWEYATEAANPGNRQHVTTIVVRLPSPRLRSGVVLVDSPGLGSLATSAAAETMAYLPRCDLGIVLIDAASTLNEDDLMPLRTLYASGVPAMVLLSKADLISAADRERTVAYIEGQLNRELGLALAVHPVSVLGADESLLNLWFDCEIAPLLERHQVLAEDSLHRKIACLSESLATSLEMLINRAGAGVRRQVQEGIANVRRLFNEADGAIRHARQQVLNWSTGREQVVELILQSAAQAAIAQAQSSTWAEAPLYQASHEIPGQLAAMARGVVLGLEQALRRSLERVRRAWPLVDRSIAAQSDMNVAGLPAPDLESFRSGSLRLRPWWASAVPKLAAGVARQRLQTRFGEALSDCVDAHDRRLRAWAKGEVERLVEYYELEAAPIREQVRRLAGNELELISAGGRHDRDMIQADLRELRQAGPPGVISSISRDSGHEVLGARDANPSRV